jgi:hypothetical protein
VQSKSKSDASSEVTNKDPIYKTHDIFCNTFNKNVKIIASEDKFSKTNCKGIIWLDFNQVRIQTITELLRTEDSRSYYLLDCGHEFKTARDKVFSKGKRIPCFRCGGVDVYRSFEHEWSHIIFKSDPFLYDQFVRSYFTNLLNRGHKLKYLREDFIKFLYLVVNAFDDLRITDLWGRVYAGSAYEITEKWKYLCNSNRDMNDNFISFIFGVALDVDNLNTQDGKFSELIPIIIKATENVKGKGPAKMLLTVRWALDKCINKLIENLPPEPDQSEEEKGNPQNQLLPAPVIQHIKQPTGDAQTEPPDNQDQSSKDDNNGGAAPPPKQDDKTRALQKMVKGSKPLDVSEDHHRPDPSKERDANSKTNDAIIKFVFGNEDVDEAFDNAIQPDEGEIDKDIQDQLDKLQSAAQPKNSQDFLLANAKAKVVIADVKRDDIKPSSEIVLTAEQNAAVARMRAAFARVMGQQRQKMSEDGVDLEVQSAIQYLVDPSENEVFEQDTIKKGFAYLTLCDMSGSMDGDPFKKVCIASEMLKKALDYPFVQDHLWGFRGATDTQYRYYRSPNDVLRATKGGEVWLFKYAQDCRGYIGRKTVIGYTNNGVKVEVKVECDGLTPLNSALHVSSKFLSTHVPVGMTKRMFLLTDGYPTQFTNKGTSLSSKSMIDFVSQEIANIRQKGIKVYTFLIGNEIKDEHALKMFGPVNTWTRISSTQSIENALVTTVCREFTRYLKDK